MRQMKTATLALTKSLERMWAGHVVWRYEGAAPPASLSSFVSEKHAMRTTLQRKVQKAACSSLLLLSAVGAAGQDTFQNLGFEDTTFTVGPNATVPGWSWSPLGTFGNGDPSTNVAYNNIALDAAAVTLQGTDSPY